MNTRVGLRNTITRTVSLIFVLISAFSFASCVQTENSSSQDAGLYGNSGGGSAFQAARTIIGQNCVPCHSYHSMSEAGLIAAGVLVARDPVNSKIFYRLVGSDGVNGPKTMPQGSSLSAADVATIRNWISGM